jgi:hypothetical protein
VPHELHRETRCFAETNCYTDLWIELLNALEFDAHAVVPFTLAVDFEGDQWTFFKPPLADLTALFGIEVEELDVYDELSTHISVQLCRGRLVIAEADAFHLPDTAGTSYQREHVKTAIGIQHIDPAARRLGYFHNAGYHELDGDDFDHVLRRVPLPAQCLAPYVELVRLDRLQRKPTSDLVRASLKLLEHHLLRRPRSNPFAAFSRCMTDTVGVVPRDLNRYHRWAFANLRQYGAAFQLAARYLRWLRAMNMRVPVSAIDGFDRISDDAKMLLLKGARAANARRALDASEALERAASSYQSAMDALAVAFPMQEAAE